MGQTLELRGEGLGTVRRVTFAGRSGRRDDRRVRPASATVHRLLVAVPRGARSGPVVLRGALGDVTRGPRSLVVKPPVRITPVTDLDASGAIFALGKRPAMFRFRATGDVAGETLEAVRSEDGSVVRTWPLAIGPDGTGEIRWDGTVEGVPQPTGQYEFRVVGDDVARVSADSASTTRFTLLDHVFPIRGKHDLGKSATSNFGGGRGHQGQDMFADCGTPLVAVTGGKVLFAGTQSRAGNYVVLQRADGQSYAYMHMRRPALVKKGDRIYAGQPIGEVGATGRASGCHLHFELWTAPGWYTGGKAVDPLPELTRWDEFS